MFIQLCLIFSLYISKVKVEEYHGELKDIQKPQGERRWNGSQEMSMFVNLSYYAKLSTRRSKKFQNFAHFAFEHPLISIPPERM